MVGGNKRCEQVLSKRVKSKDIRDVQQVRELLCESGFADTATVQDGWSELREGGKDHLCVLRPEQGYFEERVADDLDGRTDDGIGVYFGWADECGRAGVFGKTGDKVAQRGSAVGDGVTVNEQDGPYLIFDIRCCSCVISRHKEYTC